MKKSTLYIDQESVARLQAIAKALGYVARRGSLVATGGGSASELITAISNLSDDLIPELAAILIKDST